jgi:hypothetical protein
VSPLDEAEFESLLDQVRGPPTIPSEQRALAELVDGALSKPRLSSSQARRLYERYFGRR